MQLTSYIIIEQIMDNSIRSIIHEIICKNSILPLACCYRDLYVDELQTELGKCCIYFSESVPPDIALP